MSLEMKPSKSLLGEQSVCARCLSVAGSANTGPGIPVMVAPRSYTNDQTGWGNSEFFGRVKTTDGRARIIYDPRGRPHLVTGIMVAGRPNRYALVHDLKPLP